MPHKTINYLKCLTGLVALLFLFNLILTGCYYDKENELYPTPSSCDTSGVISYTHSIAPIMTANCNVCHSTALASGGVITDNYNDLSTHAKEGHLWPAVNWTGSFNMPKGGEKLPVCDLTKIRKWIDEGAPDN